MKKTFTLFLLFYFGIFCILISLRNSLDPYKSLGILNGVLIPVAVLYISQYLQEREVNRRAVLRLEMLFSKFNQLHYYLESLFQSFQHLPSDPEEQSKYQEERYLELVQYYNELLEEHSKAKLYFSQNDDKTLLQTIEEYMTEVRLCTLSWRRTHLKGQPEIDTTSSQKNWQEYIEKSNNLLNKTKESTIISLFVKAKDRCNFKNI